MVSSEVHWMLHWKLHWKIQWSVQWVFSETCNEILDSKQIDWSCPSKCTKYIYIYNIHTYCIILYCPYLLHCAKMKRMENTPKILFGVFWGMLKKILKKYFRGEPTRPKNTLKILPGVFLEYFWSASFGIFNLHKKYSKNTSGSIFSVFFGRVGSPQ